MKNKYYKRALDLIHTSIIAYNESILYKDEYSEIDHNYKQLRLRVLDFCTIFLDLSNIYIEDVYLPNKQLEKMNVYYNKKLTISLK